MIKRSDLEALYRKYNLRRYVHPDPLEFLYAYSALRDREIVGLIASSLAYGRVAQILKSVRSVLDKKGLSPYTFLRATSTSSLRRIFAGFKHRFTTDDELVSLMVGMKRAIATHGSLHACFAAGLEPDAGTVRPALERFAKELNCDGNYLIPEPRNGSACKRLNLYLRWMVRADAVDPGGWTEVPASKLIIPLDTHMTRIGQMLGFTKRKSPDMKMALEITQAFREFSPEDPVKYDFSLTRFGIRNDMDLEEFLKDPAAAAAESPHGRA